MLHSGFHQSLLQVWINPYELKYPTLNLKLIARQRTQEAEGFTHDLLQLTRSFQIQAIPSASPVMECAASKRTR